MLLEAIAAHAKEHPDRIAYQNRKEKLSYRQLWERAAALSVWLKKESGPVMIFGEKEIGMPISFLACLMAARPYLPVDPGQAIKRIEQIYQQSGAKTILTCGDYPAAEKLDAVLLEERYREYEKTGEISLPDNPLRDAYWLFTSGSTGTPKGVRISLAALENFVEWMLSIPAIAKCGQGITVNQSQFSFDLSVADLWPCFAAGATVWALKREEQQDLTVLYRALQQSSAVRLTCTPSFIRLCLCDEMFSQQLMPQLKTIFLCGESLPSRTVETLHERFPQLSIINAYGPTEAACAVCAVEVQERSGTLPVGEVKSAASKLLILDEDRVPLPEGTPGEIAIVGKSVGNGYVGAFQGGFGTFAGEKIYCTGDKGMIRDGLLWYLGRIDRQIKYKGYRIEPGEIEAALLCWKEINAAAVLPIQKAGEVRGLAAIVEWNGKKLPLSECKQRLISALPSYMLPKRWIAVEKMPMNERGKCDFHALERMLQE